MMLDTHALYAVGIAVSLAVLDRLRHRFWIFAFLAMPGTAAHECAHWLVALLMGGRPCSISVIPKRVEGGYILGTVQFRNPKWWNVPFISLAPLALIGLAYWSYTGLVAIPGETPWRIALGLFVTGSLAWGALPSGQDLSLIVRYSKPVLVAVPLLVAGGIFLAQPGVATGMVETARKAISGTDAERGAKNAAPAKAQMKKKSAQVKRR